MHAMLWVGPELKHVGNETTETKHDFRRRFVSRNRPSYFPGRFMFRETKHSGTEPRFFGVVDSHFAYIVLSGGLLVGI